MCSSAGRAGCRRKTIWELGYFKTILITGATDGIGLETARMLAGMGHRILMHGRSPAKLEAASATVRETGAEVETYIADFSSLAEVASLADAILSSGAQLDAIINNAGVLKAPETMTADGLDIRFAVNTLAPVVLTRRLVSALTPAGRIVNVSSAAQAPVSIAALEGQTALSDMDAYSQSKLAITAWSHELAGDLPNGQVTVAVNPGSLLGSKMVKDGFGIAGGDLQVGADILTRAAVSDEFADANGRYYDNDAKQFGDPHPAALDRASNATILSAIASKLTALGL